MSRNELDNFPERLTNLINILPTDSSYIYVLNLPEYFVPSSRFLLAKKTQSLVSRLAILCDSIHLLLYLFSSKQRLDPALHSRLTDILESLSLPGTVIS